MERSQLNNASHPGFTVPPSLSDFVLEQIENPTSTIGGMTLTTSIAPPGVATVNTTILPRPSAPLPDSASRLRSFPVIVPMASVIRTTPISGGFQQPQYTLYYYGGPYPYPPYYPMGSSYLPTATPYGYSTPPGPYTLGTPGFYYESVLMPSFPRMSTTMRPYVVSRPPLGQQVAPPAAASTRPLAQECPTGCGQAIQPNNLNPEFVQVRTIYTGETDNPEERREDQRNQVEHSGAHPTEGQGENQPAEKHNKPSGREGGNNRCDQRVSHTSVRQHTRERLSRRDKIDDRHDKRGRSRSHRKGKRREKDSPSPRRGVSLARVEELIQARCSHKSVLQSFSIASYTF